jgi:hypothetical protein
MAYAGGGSGGPDMGRWYGSDSIKVGTATLYVRQIKFNGTKQVVDRMKPIFESARGWIAAVLPDLTGTLQGGVRAAFDHCFISPPSFPAAVNTVKAGLTTIRTHLDGTLGIKVLPASGMPTQGTCGYVRNYFEGKGEKVDGLVQYRDRDPHDMSLDVEIKRKGEIHLRKEDVESNPVYAALTLVHEAGHKYANLRDMPKGYFKKDCVTFQSPGLTWQDALRNADSYACFVYQAVLAKFKSVTAAGLPLVK